jgi:hypothetical protein
MNLDGRARDSYLFDQEPDELLALLKVEGIDPVADALCESVDLA